MVISEEDVAALIADLERVRRETEAMQADLKIMQWEKELQKREYEAELEWLQSENVGMPMFLLLEGPQQSAPTAVALAAAAPAAEAMTGTHVFPDTAAPDASVARAARMLGSVAGSSSAICRERRAFRYYNSSWPKHGSNSSSSSSSSNISGNGSSSSSSSSNDTTSNYGPWRDTTCVVALLRPFDPGKGCQRDARRGKAVLGVDLPFDRGKA